MSGPSFISRPIVRGVLFGVVAVLAASQAEAQRWGRPNAPRSGACFYRDANFEGDYFCLRAGEDLQSIPNELNDQISSIRTFGNAEVTVFQNRNFQGRSERFADVRNLRNEGWNDKLSSLRVEGRGGFGSGSGGFGSGSGGFGSGSGGFGNGGGFGNNGASAERIVRRAYQDILNREPDQQGMRTFRSRIIDDNWTEEQVRDALRRSPEFREQNTMTPQRAAEVVRRAYLAVLNREPDEAGAQGFIQRVLRDRWTEEDVARELRRSPEYRNQARPR